MLLFLFLLLDMMPPRWTLWNMDPLRLLKVCAVFVFFYLYLKNISNETFLFFFLFYRDDTGFLEFDGTKTQTDM